MASNFQKLPYEMQWLLANGFNTKTQGNKPVTRWTTGDIDNEFSTKSQLERDILVTAADQSRRRLIAEDEANEFMAKQWEPYGGLPGSKTGPSETWKYGYGKMSPEGMKNPIAIQTPVNNAPGAGGIGGYYTNIPGMGRNRPAGGAEKAGLIMYYDMPVDKPPTTTPGGAPLPIPSVQERMTRMGEAVQKGIDKGSIGANQMQDKFKYQVPGTTPATPVTKPVAAPKTNTLAGMTRLT